MIFLLLSRLQYCNVITFCQLVRSLTKIFLFREEEKKEEPLVIPLLGSRTWHDRIINKIDADIFEIKTIKNETLTQDVKIKEEPKEISNGDLTSINENVANIEIKTELERVDQDESKTSTLEEQAAKEIMEDLKSTEKEKKELINLTLPLAEDQNLRGVEVVSFFNNIYSKLYNAI